MVLQFHTTLSKIDPSLKRRSSAFSPQKLRNWVAFEISLAGGPWSTKRRLDSGSTKRPMVRVVGECVGEEEIGKEVLGEDAIEIKVTRDVNAVWRIEVVRHREVNA